MKKKLNFFIQIFAVLITRKSLKDLEDRQTRIFDDIIKHQHCHLCHYLIWVCCSIWTFYPRPCIYGYIAITLFVYPFLCMISKYFCQIFQTPNFCFQILWIMIGNMLSMKTCTTFCFPMRFKRLIKLIICANNGSLGQKYVSSLGNMSDHIVYRVK